MASLKYLFTELVCALAGGPEQMTAPSMPDTRLGLSGGDFVKLLACAAAAGDHLEPPALAAELAVALHGRMDLVLGAPPDWDASAATVTKLSTTTASQGQVKLKVEKLGAELGVPLLYVPNRSKGTLLALEAGPLPGRVPPFEQEFFKVRRHFPPVLPRPGTLRGPRKEEIVAVFMCRRGPT